MTVVRFVASDPNGLRADKATRRITGLLVPFGEVATPSVGPRCAFAADGAYEFPDSVVLNLEHDGSRPLGRGTLEVRADGLHAVFTIANTTAGTDALTEAAEGLRGGLSVEAEILASTNAGEFEQISAARITEAALVRRAAFQSAAVYDVAATAATNSTPEETTMDTDTAVVDTPATDPAPVTVAAAAPLPPTATVRVNEPLPTAAEYIIAMGRGDADTIRRVRAASPHTFVADIPGIIPKEIVGPVLSLKDGSSPLFNALGPNQAPPGASFTLPVVTTELANAATATEKTDVTGQLIVGGPTVSMKFVKRAANISAEAIQYSQPGVVAVALESLARAIGGGQEAVATAAIEAATGTNASVALEADGSDAWAKLADAMAVFYSATAQRPDVFGCAVDVWAALAGMTNSLGQPLVNGISQSLVGGWGNIFGVPIVVSPTMTAGKSYLASSYGVKSWASSEVQMQAEEPSIMGFAVGAGRNVGLSIASPKFLTPVTVTATP